MLLHFLRFFFFFFNDTATTEIYTLSLHDALPICSTTPSLTHASASRTPPPKLACALRAGSIHLSDAGDRKSTRLNSSHLVISYAVFCLKKKKKLLPHPCLGLDRKHTLMYHITTYI